MFENTSRNLSNTDILQLVQMAQGDGNGATHLVVLRANSDHFGDDVAVSVKVTQTGNIDGDLKRAVMDADEDGNVPVTVSSCNIVAAYDLSKSVEAVKGLKGAEILKGAIVQLGTQTSMSGPTLFH